MQKINHYEAIFENNPDGVVLIAIPSFKVKLCNATFAKMIGYTKEDIDALKKERVV